MSSIVVAGDTSGTVTLQAPAVAGSSVLTLPASTGTVTATASAVSAVGQIPFSTDGSTWSSTAKIVSATAQASTSGTSIDFTGIPSWVKRITVMFNGVSLSGSANFFLQLGSGSPTTSGYLGSTGSIQNAGASATMINNSGLGVIGGGTNVVLQGSAIFSLLNSSANTWVGNHTISRSDSSIPQFGSATISLSGVLDRVRITSSNGTDTFDAGSINIMYE